MLLLSFLIFLCGGAVVGVLVGAGMLLKPERILALNRYLYRWVGTEKTEQQFDRPRWIERFFYRHHRLTGGIILTGAMFVLYNMLFSSHNVHAVSVALAPGTWGLVDAAEGMLLVGNVLAALIGIIVLTKPSLLRNTEQWANRWIATDGVLKFFNGMHYSFDRYSFRHRKIVGVFMLIGSLFILTVLGRMLWSGAWKF